MKKKYVMIIDVLKCENCNNCFLACKDEHCGNDWPGYTLSQPLHGHRWMNIARRERGEFPFVDVAYLPKPCMHCDDAPCVAAAENGAVTKRDDGIVLIDQEKAKGCKNLSSACPYGAIWWNDTVEVPQKCTFCAHLLDDGWEAPRCVQACPTGALTFFHFTEPELGALIASEQLETLGNSPQRSGAGVYYKNLYRYRSCMIAGSVATGIKGITMCVEGAGVSLIKEGVVLDETVTDDFGDFRFDGLDQGSGSYEVAITVGDIFRTVNAGTLEKSIVLSTIWLDGEEGLKG